MLELSLHTTLDAVAADWHELEQAQPDRCLLTAFDLTREWYARFSDTDRIAVCGVRDGYRPIGLLPLERRTRYGIAGLRSLANWHFTLSEPIIRPGFEAAFARCLCDQLFAKAPGITTLKLVHLYSFSPFQPALTALPPAACSSLLQWSLPTYCVDLRAGFEAYFRQFLKKKIRDNFKTNRKKMETDHGLRLDFYRDDAALAQWDRFTAIEDTGWKERQHSSINHLPEAYTAFYRTFSAFAATRGALRICILSLDGRPAAGIYGFLDSGVFHAAKTGLHPDFAQYSASNILFIETVRHLIEQEPTARLLHLYPDDYGYKHRYCATDHRCSTVIHTRRSVLGSLVGGAYRLKKHTLPRLRQHFARKPLATD